MQHRCVVLLCLILALSTTGCVTSAYVRTKAADVLDTGRHRVCPVNTPVEALDAEVGIRFVGTPGHRFLGCGTLSVSTIEVYVPAGWRVLRWERVPGAWTYALLFQVGAGKPFPRTYELLTLTRRYDAELEGTVEFRWFGTKQTAASPTPSCCPAVLTPTRPLLPDSAFAKTATTPYDTNRKKKKD